jgi:uncharacterized protein YkwD
MGCARATPLDRAGAAALGCDATQGQEIVERTNDIRRGRGLASLRVDDRLARAARAHSEDLARRDDGGHLGGDGSLPDVRAGRTGYAWTFIAENVAVGQQAASQVVAQWMDSPEHRSNIVSREAIHVGVGYAFRAGTRWKHFWTALYGSAATLTPSPDGCNP